MNTSELFDEVDLNHILEAVMDYKVRLMRGEVDTAGGYDVRKATVSALTLIVSLGSGCATSKPAAA